MLYHLVLHHVRQIILLITHILSFFSLNKNKDDPISSQANKEKLKFRFKSQHDHYLKRSLVFLEVLQLSNSTKLNYESKLYFLFSRSRHKYLF